MPNKATTLKAMADQVNPRELFFLDAKSGSVGDETPAEYANGTLFSEAD